MIYIMAWTAVAIKYKNDDCSKNLVTATYVDRGSFCSLALFSLLVSYTW